jgi:hypothetical protein
VAEAEEAQDSRQEAAGAHPQPQVPVLCLFADRPVEEEEEAVHPGEVEVPPYQVRRVRPQAVLQAP